MSADQYQAIMGTLDSLVMVAGDVIDEVTSIRAEIEQTFVKIEETTERRASA